MKGVYLTAEVSVFLLCARESAIQISRTIGNQRRF
nr:MAG TPA: hypothetical protein [Caudoviricetes sp.]